MDWFASHAARSSSPHAAPGVPIGYALPCTHGGERRRAGFNCARRKEKRGVRKRPVHFKMDHFKGAGGERERARASGADLVVLATHASYSVRDVNSDSVKESTILLLG